MLPIRCSQPPCRNIDVSSVSSSTGSDVSPVSAANRRPGTTPQSRRNSCVPSASDSSYTKTSTFARMMPRVTNGTR